VPADIRPGRYRHFKGAVYVVVGIATHSESEEPFVVYHRDGDERLWVRPAAMWRETVERDGVVAPRFAPIPGVD
jgi:hypothetical protein